MFYQQCDNEEDHVSHRYWTIDPYGIETEWTCNGAGIFRL